MKQNKYHWCIGLLFLIAFGWAAAAVSPLPSEQAFPLKVWSLDPQTVIVQWDIKPGYYLYKDRIHIVPAANSAVQLGTPRFPLAVDHVSPLLGHFAAYEDRTQISIPVLSAEPPSFSLEIKYQGCAEQGYCYPPETRVVSVALNTGNPSFAALPIDRIPDHTLTLSPAPLQTLLPAGYHWTTWLGFFGLGLLISLTPCVLPMIPVLFGLILGKKENVPVSHWRAFFISLAYVLGMAVTYAIVGVLFGIIGSSLQAFLQKPWIIVAFSGVFIMMAFSLFGVYSIEPPEKLRAWTARLSNRQSRGSITGAMVMGCLSTLILSPCATPPLVAVLTYISQTGNARLGGIALFIIALGSGTPLLLLGSLGRHFLPKTGAWMQVVENVLGVVLLGAGIWMLSRILPNWITLILWALLAIGSAISLKIFTTATTRLQLIGKGLGILIFVYGILLLVGSMQGASEPWQPLLLGTQPCLTSSSPHFASVKTIANVQEQMDNNPNMPVLLDFYADWCVSCKLLEQRVFTNPAVQNQLRDFLLLRADITANNNEDRALMNHYQVIAPPTILLFDRQHQERQESRIVGEISPTEFLKRVRPENLNLGSAS